MKRSRVTLSVDALPAKIRKDLRKRAIRADAEPMQRYMKSEMPFIGVKKPGRAEVMSALKKQWAPSSPEEYESAVLALWAGTYREERYMAIAVARAYPAFVTLDSMPLYERLIREGAWWDFVDEVAIQLVGGLWARHRAVVSKQMDLWLEDQNRWIRRTTLIGQLKHRDSTDHRRLFRYCRAQMDDEDFFIRKGMGWALREYGKTDPERVRAFLIRHRRSLSPLSLREGARVLISKGLLTSEELA